MTWSAWAVTTQYTLEAIGRAGTLEGAAEKVAHVDVEYDRVNWTLETERTDVGGCKG